MGLDGRKILFLPFPVIPLLHEKTHEVLYLRDFRQIISRWWARASLNSWNVGR